MLPCPNNRFSTGFASLLSPWDTSTSGTSSTEISSHKIYFCQRTTKLKLVILAFQKSLIIPWIWRRPKLVRHTTCLPRFAWDRSTTTNPICGCWVVSCMSSAHLVDLSKVMGFMRCTPRLRKLTTQSLVILMTRYFTSSSTYYSKSRLQLEHRSRRYWTCPK